MHSSILFVMRLNNSHKGAIKMKKFLSILSALSLAAALTVGSSAVLLGDVNSDGEINSSDALSILRYSVGFEVENFDESAADVNYDMIVNSSDALKVLRISVGLEESEIALTEKAEILDYYNNALNKTYAETKHIHLVENVQYDLFVDYDGTTIKRDPVIVDIDFKNGYDETGLPPNAYAPDSKLTEEMIELAYFEKCDDGYMVDLTLKGEAVSIFDSPEYQCAGGIPFYYYVPEGEDFEYEDGEIQYYGTGIEAIIDGEGYVKSISVYTPYESHYTISVYDYEEDVYYYGDFMENGYWKQDINIIR